MYDLSVACVQIPAILVHCDNQTAATAISNNLFNSKKRTVRLRHRVLNNRIKGDIIAIVDVRSQEDLADLFTKGLKRQVVDNTTRKMSLKNLWY